MKKKFLWVLTMATVLVLFTGTSVMAKTVASGKCGEKAKWSLDSNGKLTVSGSGEMSAANGDGSVSDMDGLEKYSNKIISIEIKNGITRIGSFTFRECSKLKNIKMASSVKTIGAYAFGTCKSLKNFEVPSGLKNIETYGGSSAATVFDGFPNLKKITVNKNNKYFSAKDGVLYNKSGTKLITYPLGKKGAFVVPGKVTAIAAGAFSFRQKLTKITIGDKVKKIESYAFSGCTKLEEVKIGKQVKTIEGYAFSRCSKLKKVTIGKSVSKIGLGVFDNCVKLQSFTVDKENKNYSVKDGILYNKSRTNLILCPVGKGGTVTVPTSVKTIENNAFFRCSKVTKIILGNSVTKIGDAAFGSCSKLTTIILGNSVTKIGPAAFSGCSKLTRITLGDSVTKIGGDAFSGCSKLTDIEIGEGVTSLGNYLFIGCNKLKTITIKSTKLTKKKLGYDVFGSVPKSAVVKVPSNKVEEYTELFQTAGLSEEATVKAY